MPSEVHKAMRAAIQDQVDLFKSIKFKEAKECGSAPLCPLRGTVMTTDNCHVDHITPNTVLSLQSRWMSEQGLALSDIELSGGDQSGPQTMASVQLLSSWQQFHRQHACLRLLSSKANLSRAAKQLF